MQRLCIHQYFNYYIHHFITCASTHNTILCDFTELLRQELLQHAISRPVCCFCYQFHPSVL